MKIQTLYGLKLCCGSLTLHNDIFDINVLTQKEHSSLSVGITWRAEGWLTGGDPERRPVRKVGGHLKSEIVR